MRPASARLGFAALRSGVKPPRARFLARYKEHWFLKNLLERLRISLVLDVGANIGQFAENLRFMGYQGRIVSFEPIPSEYRALLSRTNGDPRWAVHQLALGSTPGIAAFNVIEEDGVTVYSSFLKPADAQVPPVARSQEVEVQRLDALWPKIVRPDDRVFLKVDTQGFDMEVMKGAGDRLSEVLGLQTEMSVIGLYEGQPHYLEALQFLESKNFSLLELRPIDRDESGAVIEFDCFMARTGEMK